MSYVTCKVCLVSWAPFYAGAEVAAERLALGLRENGREVIVVVGTDGELLQRLQDAGIKTYFAPTRFTDKWKCLKYRKSRAKLMQILRVEQPDLIHSNDLPSHQMASDAARRLDIPRICHHRWIFEGPAIDWFNKFEADRHLFVSKALMKQLCEASPRLAARPCAVVHDGLPLPPLPTSAQRRATRERLGLPTDKKLMLFAGQIIERKGVADLIAAWNLLAPGASEQAELVIVGDDIAEQGKYRQQMEQLAQALGRPIRFVGFQQNVGDWLTAADLAGVPSHAEPLGNATLEAMSYALPVIGADVGGIPEMIVHQQTGLLVSARSPEQLAAAIDKLLSDDALRTRMGVAGRQRCEEHFSLQAHVNAVVEQYDAVLSQKPVKIGS